MQSENIWLPDFGKRQNQEGGVPDGVPTIVVPSKPLREFAFGMSDQETYLQTVASGVATFYLPSGTRVTDTTRRVRQIRGDCDVDAIAFMMGPGHGRNRFRHELVVHPPTRDGWREPLSGIAVVAVVEVETSEPLMVGYANEEALALTLEREQVVLWSTSRNQLWIKGETSGNTLQVYDVTQDTSGCFIIYWVQEVRHPACHMEARSCFFHDMTARTLLETPPKLPSDHIRNLRPVQAEVHASLRAS